MPPLLGVVLAGGKSSRMGLDKSALELGGKRLAEWALCALAPLVGRRLVSGPGGLADPAPGLGPAAGILAALRALAPGEEGALVLACDMPLISARELEILARAEKRPGTCAHVFQWPDTGFIEMTAALYWKEALPRFEDALASGERKLRAILPPDALLRAAIPRGSAWRFANCNTPEDFKAARELFEARLSGAKG